MSSIDRSDVELIIASATNEANVKILDYKLEPFAAEKCGILGEHHLLKVVLEDRKLDANENCRVKVCKFFVKLMGDVNNLPSHLDPEVFEEEIRFYTKIKPLMLENYKGEEWCAKWYLAKKGVLVLEDLRERGFVSLKTEEAMSDSSLKSAVATLARFHACSVIAETKLGKPLNEAFPNFFSEKMYNDDNKFGRAVKLGYETQILLAEKLGLDAKLVPEIRNYASQAVKPIKQEMNVIGHSDLYKYNIMFNADSAAIILDYQLLRYASPVIDISTLVYMNTTPEYRKKLGILDILEHYYLVFRETLQENEVNISVPWSYEYMIDKYNEKKIVGMAMSVDYLASLYLDCKLRFQIWNDPEVFGKYFLCERMDILGPELETDYNYASKMKDILSEYLDEAKRLWDDCLLK